MAAVDGNGDRTAAIAQALDAMWARFLPEIRARVNLLNAAAEAAAAGSLNDDLRQAAQAAAHKLAGTLGTFGLQRGTELARVLETRFASGKLRADEAAALATIAQQMRAIVESRG